MSLKPSSSYLDIHKKAMDKNYRRKNFEERLKDFKDIRKQTRQGIFLSRRNINENNISPFETPEVNVPRKETEKSCNTNKETKMEKLRKWKAEKEKRKLEEKKNAKPRFTVGRVRVEVGMPNIDKAIREIKGKPIKSMYKFAPENHVFKPPSNIERLKGSATSSKANLTNKLKSTKAIENMKVTQASTANGRIAKPVERLPPKKLSKQESATKSKDSNKVRRPGVTLTGAKKTTVVGLTSNPTSSTQSTILKNVWKIKTLKKVQFKEHVYATTSSRHKNDSAMFESKDTGTKNKEHTMAPSPIEEKSKVIYSDDEITMRTPRRSGHTPARKSKNDSAMFESNDTGTKNKVRYGETAIIVIEDTITPSPIEEKSKVIYSDDEITMRTPRRSGHTPARKSKKSTPFPKASKKNDLNEDDIPMETNEESSMFQQLYLKVDRCDIPATMAAKYEEEQHKSVIIYSDDEISMKTPRRSGLTPARKSKRITPLSKASKKTHLKYGELENEAADEAVSSQILSIKLNKNDVLLEEHQANTDSSEKNTNTSARNKRKSRISGALSIGSTRKSAKKQSLLGKRWSTAELNSQEAADHFTEILNDEIARIEAVCAEWDEYKNENSLSEDSQDMINAAIGQSKLLIAKKFPQFRDLIEKCRTSSYVGKPVTSQDLHGYWDTAYIQVQDLDKRFQQLEILKQNNWEEIQQPKEKATRKKKGKAAKKKVVSSRMKDIIKAAREKKLKESRLSSSNKRLSKGRRSSRISGLFQSSKIQTPGSSKKIL